RWRTDGVLEFGGRADDQVKVRGFRIEPGEIEASLMALDGVSQAAVVLREVADEQRLVAYVVGGDVPPASDLRAALGAVLPEYMVPSSFVVLEGLPLTTSGKLDRRALPAPEIVGVSAYEAPESATEALLCRLYGELTGAGRVSVTDNFFALGGHSLMAMRLVVRLREELGVEVPLRAVFAEASPRALARVVEGAATSERAGVVSGQGDLGGGRVVLSWGQERLWTLDRLSPGASEYNIPFSLWLEGALDTGALDQALRGLIMRHTALRTVIDGATGEPVGSVLEDAGNVLEVVDLTGTVPPQGEAPDAARDHALVLAQTFAVRPFDLSCEVSLRGQVITLGKDTYFLTLVAHHGACDGSSLAVLWSELAALYRSARTPGRSDLAPLPWQYADYAAWHRTWLEESVVLARDLDYWRDHLAGAPACLALPLDGGRDADRSRRAGYESFSLDPALSGRLEALARERGMTVFGVVLGVYGLLLSWLSRDDTVVIGTPVAGREAPGSEGLIGFFVNTLALHLDLGSCRTVGDLLAHTGNVVQDGLEHQQAPFERVVEALDVERSLAHTPVFQAMFAWQSQEMGEAALDDVAATAALGIGSGVGLDRAKFDLTLAMMPGADGVAGVLEYDADLFDEERVAQWCDLLVSLLQQMAGAADGAALATLSLVTADGAAQLSGFQGDVCEIPEDTTPDLLTAQALRTPDGEAVVFEGDSLSYGALAARSNQLARHLVAQGAGP
ncbi:MAG: non-ribosomal peptide synthetase, partial [Rhodospirillaceae bacterium]|nr:non-ribosomal peptide synthetase [Rhodospirillaceae bacterium]